MRGYLQQKKEQNAVPSKIKRACEKQVLTTQGTAQLSSTHQLTSVLKVGASFRFKTKRKASGTLQR